MKASDLVAELETFRQALRKHEQLWGKSLAQPIPDYPVKNIAQLREQSESLNRQLGRLRPYIELYEKNWTMHHPATGVAWDALESAVGTSVVAQIKGPSLRKVMDRLGQITGRLEAEDPDEDISLAPPRSVAAASRRPEDPTTLEKVSLAEFLRALGRLSISAWILILTLLIGLVSATVAVTRFLSEESPTLRDRQVLDSVTTERDSLAAQLRELRAETDSGP